jgi:autotransporter-associated beta strand protein
MLLSGNNTYTGVTDIREGILGVSGTSASSEFLVAPGATLQTNGTTLTLGNRQTIRGGGTLIGNINNAAGIIAPGMSPGTLTLLGNYTQGGTGIMNIEVASLSSFDQLLVSGNATLGGTLNIAFLPGILATVFRSGVVRLHDGGRHPERILRPDQRFRVPGTNPVPRDQRQTGAGSTGFRVSFVVIPEANTGLLALLAAPGLLLLRRKTDRHTDVRAS